MALQPEVEGTGKALLRGAAVDIECSDQSGVAPRRDPLGVERFGGLKRHGYFQHAAPRQVVIASGELVVIFAALRMTEHKGGVDRGGHRVVRTANGAPDDFVEQMIVGCVLF